MTDNEFSWEGRTYGNLKHDLIAAYLAIDIRGVAAKNQRGEIGPNFLMGADRECLLAALVSRPRRNRGRLWGEGGGSRQNSNQ